MIKKQAIKELKSLSPSQEAIDTVLNKLKENSAEIQQKNTELAEKDAKISELSKKLYLCTPEIPQCQHGEYVSYTDLIDKIIEKDKEIDKLRNKNKELLRKLRNRVKEVKKLTKYSQYKKEFSRLNEQLRKKDKIIDLMAEYLIGVHIDNYDPTWEHEFEKDNFIILRSKEEVKQYIERKATNNG